MSGMMSLFDDQEAGIEVLATAPAPVRARGERFCMECGFNEIPPHCFPTLRFANGKSGLICSNGCRTELEAKNGAGKQSWDPEPEGRRA